MTNTSSLTTKKHVTPQVALIPTNNNNKNSTQQPHIKKAGPKTTVKEPSSHSKSAKPKTNKKQQRMATSDGETTDGGITNKQKLKKQPKSSAINPTQTPAVVNKQAQPSHNHQHHQQQRRNVVPVKVRRMERRKDIESMTEALQTSQADLLSSSPPVSSATESEDSDPGRMEQKKRQGNNKIKKKPNVDNAATFPPLNRTNLWFWTILLIFTLFIPPSFPPSPPPPFFFISLFDSFMFLFIISSSPCIF
ncbi:hypothetical protein BC941DRAFT_134312 [Chlamydoabsidia padenii]|nr:hypothetical protein BC941DRAFT_134312 [Chlamydoabsidia padenii]